MSGQDQQKKRGWAAKAEAAKAAKASAAADVATEAMEDEDFAEEEYVPTEADGGMFGDVPAKKAKAFWPSAKRLMGLLKPERIGVSIVIGLVVVSVVLNVIAPKILGSAWTSSLAASSASSSLPE